MKSPDLAPIALTPGPQELGKRRGSGLEIWGFSTQLLSCL